MRLRRSKSDSKTVTDVPYVTDTEWAWLAGLLEGEGCFRSHRGTATIELEMTDQDVVDRAAKLVPGGRTVVRRSQRKSRNGSQYKPSFRYSWYGPRAVEVMYGVTPYMGLRRKEKIGMILAADLKRKGVIV